MVRHIVDQTSSPGPSEQRERSEQVDSEQGMDKETVPLVMPQPDGQDVVVVKGPPTSRVRPCGTLWMLRVGLGLCSLVVISTVVRYGVYYRRTFFSNQKYQYAPSYCPEYEQLVRRYLAPYRNPVPPNVQEKAEEILSKTAQPCHYVNVSGEQIIMWPEERAKRHPRSMEFARNVRAAMDLFGPLPDVQVWFCAGDEPELPKSAFPGLSTPRPPLSYCMRGDYHGISIPFKVQDVAHEEEQLKRLDTLHKRSPWNTRKPKGVWRGSTTGVTNGKTCQSGNWRELSRSKLVKLSLENKDVLDATYAFNSQCPKDVVAKIEAEGYGFSEMYRFEDYFKYQMLVDVDGNTWSSRFGELLSTGSVVFKQESEYWDWFLPLAVPFKDYVPVKRDLSDLIPQMRSLSSSERNAELAEIGAEAHRFFRRLLTPSKQLCYIHVLLTEYATLDPPSKLLRGGFNTASTGATQRL